MKKFKKIISLFLTFFFVVFSFATGVSAKTEKFKNNEEIEKQVDEYINALSKQYPFSGSILISQNGKVVFKKGYGHANYECKIPNKPSTKFTLASITKQFVAVGIMMLQEKDKLNVNDPISKYMKDYPNGDKITIHHLLTHTSGIGEYFDGDFNKTKQSKRPCTMDELIDLFKNKPVLFQPGESFSYCNSNYVLLGRIIETVSGIPCEEFLDDNIFRPLNMKSTGFYIDYAYPCNRAYEYKRTEDGISSIRGGGDYIHSTTASMAGGMYSTVEDLYLWDQGLKNGKILSKESLSKIYTSYTSTLNYGYGVEVNNRHGKKCIMHSGGMPGVENYIFRYIDDNTCIVLLSNLPGAGLSVVEKNVYSILYEGKFDAPKELKEIKLDEQTLDSYVGKYEWMPGIVFNVSREGNVLCVGDEGDEKDKFYPFSQTQFFHKLKNMQLEFTDIQNGKAMKAMYTFGDEVLNLKRVE